MLISITDLDGRTIAKITRQARRKMWPFLADVAADVVCATAFGRASVIRIFPSVSRRCARVGLCVGALCACCKEGPIGTAARGRTGPAMHMPKSLASLSWLSRPSRTSGQPSCGKRLPPRTRGARHRRLGSRHRRRYVQEREDAHREERRRKSALEPISKQCPAAQRPLHAGRGKPTRNDSTPAEGGQACGRTAA